MLKAEGTQSKETQVENRERVKEKNKVAEKEGERINAEQKESVTNAGSMRVKIGGK